MLCFLVSDTLASRILRVFHAFLTIGEPLIVRTSGIPSLGCLMGRLVVS